MHTSRRAGGKKHLALLLTLLMLLTSFLSVNSTSASTVTNLALNSTPGTIKNVSFGKPVTGSLSFSNMSVINDGVKNNTNAYSQDYPNGSGLQWIQIDLGKSYDLSSVNIWHYWYDGRKYHDVIVRLSNKSDFSSEVTTVFNNDTNNSAGFGAGSDTEYTETSAGKSISFNNTNARYVRIYSNGSTSNTNNHYVEVEVMGAEPPPTAPPIAPTGYAYPMGTSRINASWNLPEGASGYDIEVDGTVITDVTMPYGHTGLAAGTTHNYRVRAKNNLGTSGWSTLFSSTTLVPVESGFRFMGPQPGEAQGTNPSSGVYVLNNAILSAKFQLLGNNLTLTEFKDNMTGNVNPITVGKLFNIELSGGTSLVDTDMTAGTPTLTKITRNASSVKVSDRYDGWKISVPFTYVSGGNTLTVNWSATLRDGSNYIIQDVSYSAATGSWNVTKVKLIDITAAGVEKAGVVDGSPFFAGKVFFAQQTPVAKVSISGNKASAYVERGEATLQGQSFAQSSVIGIYPGNQKQRAFQYYLERERAHEHYSFLHYNSWYDLSWITDTYMTEADSLDVINTWGQKFVQQRGAALKNFLFDDGYDDYSSTASTIWDFNPKTYPNGASKMKSAAESFGASLGFWLSPTGGYYDKLTKRIAVGKKMNPPTETKMSSTGEEIFKMSGPNYYNAFKHAVTKKQLVEGANHFKFDRTEGIEDFHALLRLTQDMRSNDPSVFINATVGTWASPYFTFYVDSIWRGGGDMGKAGTGTIRQQWVNYRDKVSRDLLQKNPFYPLNSLMVHGIVHSRFGQGAWNSHVGGTESGPLLDMTDPANLKDFADEVWSYFASGYNLQELYIRPTSDYTTDKMWDTLAEASAWAQLNHDVLLDSHFIGGDPGKGEPYGIASYSTAKAVLMLRNSGNTSQTMNIDVNEAFVLPPGAKTGYKLVNKLKNETDLHLTAGVPYAITIPANSIVLYEAYPEGTVVIPDADADLKSVALDKAALDIGYANGDSASQVTQSIILNASGTNGSTITWSSSAPLLVSTDGTVTRPPYTSGDATVTLTATISKGAVTDTKTFTLKVLKQLDTTPPTPTATLKGPASVSSGQTFDVTYTLNTVSKNVYAQDVTITYDPQQLEYIAANSLVDGWKIVAVSTETNGKIRMIAANVGSHPSAVGELFKLTLKVKASSAGSSTIALTNAAYASGDGVETTVEGTAYHVQIAAGTQGDLNGDNKFSIGDLAMVASYYGKTSADLNWNEIYKKADMNNDGEINILDLSAVAQLIFN
ncbi:immunoglobulin-like domain-containing protein [Paenibacillus sp. GCM10023248]|uniref:immunoglobulin-like domain-containing protein n=1 Tax=unclassified Paenibacillus TaxID=185978 RepID=UPI0023787A1F|nr:immunoglobulin-like domain-containing protein [Paenibacillus sp. MAHUQ-63]MDD9265470.1 cohesin domain-containing protein [Paenibacillus sp. MAHUQ-63]